MTLKEMQTLPLNKQKELFKKIDGNRYTSKQVNFSAIYGVGPPKLAKTLKIPVKEAETLLKAYWILNHAVKKVAEDCIIKKVKGQKWLFNPVSGFWYFLKEDKDAFSTLNQGRQSCSE